MTVELFLENSYLTECEAKILQIDGDKVILDRTVCYPTGGGQEHDTGVILQDGNAFEIVNVKRENGKIIHYVSRAEQLKTGDAVVRIDWERRYGLMVTTPCYTCWPLS